MIHEKNYLRSQEKKRSSLIVSWTISYITIFFITIIIYLLFTLYTYSITLKQDSDYLKKNISLKAEALDNTFTDALSYTSTLYLNTNVQKISKLTTETMRPSDHIYLHNISSSLSKTVGLSYFFSDIRIYFPTIQMVATSDTLYSFDLLPYLSKDSTSVQEQLDEIQSFLAQRQDIYISLHPSTNNIVIAQALYTNASGHLTSYVIYELNSEFFLERLITDVENSYIMLTNDFQLLLYPHETPEDLVTDFMSLISEVSDVTDNIFPQEYISASGNKYILISQDSLVPGLHYISLTSHDRYNQIYLPLTRAFIVTMLVSLLLSTFFTIYFIRKNYAPVQEIMNHLIPISAETTSKNEYSIILNNIISTSSELEKQRKLLANNYLQKILLGETPYSNNFLYKKQLPLDIPGTCFYISIIRIINDTNEDRALNIFIIKNVLQELLLSHHFRVHFCEFADSIACIISYNEEKPDSTDDILNAHHFLHEFCLTYYGFQLNIGLSNKWEEKEYISQAYTQAEDTLEYIRFFNCAPVYVFSSIPVMNNLSSLIIHDFKHMTDMVTNIQKSEIENFFSSLSDNFKTHSITLIEGKNILYYYYQLLTQLRLLMHQKYPAVSFDALNNLDYSILNMPILDATQITCNLLLNACDFIQGQKTNNQQLLISHVCLYIDNNYFDDNLNQTTIADHFHMTPAYLAQKFKAEKGITIIQYLYSVRIQHAIELMKQNKLKISEIATIVGFPNSNAFIRIFKQYTGTTPGKYYVE